MFDFPVFSVRRKQQSGQSLSLFHSAGKIFDAGILIALYFSAAVINKKLLFIKFLGEFRYFEVMALVATTETHWTSCIKVSWVNH